MFIVEQKLNDILNTPGSGYPNTLTSEVRQSLFLYFDSFASTVSIRDAGATEASAGASVKRSTKSNS